MVLGAWWDLSSVMTNAPMFHVQSDSGRPLGAE